MSLADPKAALILQTIIDRLSVLTIAAPSVYATVASEVVTPTRQILDTGTDAIPETPKDAQISVSIGDLNRSETYNTAGNPHSEGWTVEYRVRLRLMPSETDSEGIDFKLMRFVRDVRKAISGGATYDHNWGKMDGDAIDARWGDTFERLVNDGTSQSDGYVMPLLVDLRLNENAL